MSLQIDGEETPDYSQWQTVLVVGTCGLIVAGTILGNVLVCTAVAIVRKLRTPSNLLIVSLAVSDLLVAVLVMPFATTYEVMGRWVLGQPVCDMWTSLDVMLCTASILNLCMISVDRYFVITRPFQYAMKRTPLRMTLMIVSVWMLSALISIPPLFGWKEDPKEGQCFLSQKIGYQFYATIGAFYLPLAVMIVIYYRIYMVSARIAKAEAKSKPNGDFHRSAPSSRRCTTSVNLSPASGGMSGRSSLDGYQIAEPRLHKLKFLQRFSMPNGCAADRTDLQMIALQPAISQDGGVVTKVIPSRRERPLSEVRTQILGVHRRFRRSAKLQRRSV